MPAAVMLQSVLKLRVLVLGGSSEGSALATALGDDMRFDATLSLAGRTRAPAPLPSSRSLAWSLARRTGGFGGAEGLAQYCDDHAIDAVVVAVHPFAAQMRRNAVAAVRLRPMPLLIVDRPAWTATPEDRWTCVPDMAEAATALGEGPRRVLLTVGRQDLAPFVARDHHFYLVRSIDPPDRLPAGAALILDRGPFAEADERRLMADNGVEILVTKNAGGSATQAKLAAARVLGLPVVMVDRPLLPDVTDLEIEIAAGVNQALAWLAHQARSVTDRGV